MELGGMPEPMILLNKKKSEGKAIIDQGWSKYSIKIAAAEKAEKGNRR